MALVTVAAGLALTLVATTLWLRHRYVVIDVIGTSMEPAYRAGSRVLVRRTPVARVQRGQPVVFERDYGEVEPTVDADSFVEWRPAARWRPSWARAGWDRSWMLKRAIAIPGDPIPRDQVPALRDAPGNVVPAGCLVVMGDNPVGSLDSRHYGYVRRGRVLGVAVRRMRNHAAPDAS
jgi:signal peptidase I